MAALLSALVGSGRGGRRADGGAMGAAAPDLDDLGGEHAFLPGRLLAMPGPGARAPSATELSYGSDELDGLGVLQQQAAGSGAECREEAGVAGVGGRQQ